MFTIGLYGTTDERKQMEKVLSQYLKEKNIRFKIYQTYSSNKFITEYIPNNFNLYMTCMDKKIVYMLKKYDNSNLKTSNYISKTIEFPLKYDDIVKLKIKNHPLNYDCPYGIYILNTKNTLYGILHEEIEYIHRVKNKSVIHLSSGDTEETSKSLVQIEKELDRRHFVRCNKGYIVNLFHVNKVNENWKIIQLNSGSEIPLSMNGRKKFLKGLSLLVTNEDIFN